MTGPTEDANLRPDAPMGMAPGRFDDDERE